MPRVAVVRLVPLRLFEFLGPRSLAGGWDPLAFMNEPCNINRFGDRLFGCQSTDGQAAGFD
jgi:hypothetical protein